MNVYLSVYFMRVLWFRCIIPLLQESHLRSFICIFIYACVCVGVAREKEREINTYIHTYINRYRWINITARRIGR